MDSFEPLLAEVAEKSENSESRKNFWARTYSYFVSIKTKLLISFLALTILPLVYMSYVLMKNSTRGLFSVIMRNSMANARKASIDADRFLDGIVDMARVIRGDQSLAQGDIEGFRARLGELDQRYTTIEGIYTVENGKLSFGTMDLTGNETLPLDFKAIERGLTARDYLLVTIPGHDGFRGAGAALAFRAGKDKTLQTVIIHISLLALRNILNENVSGKTERIYLLDQVFTPLTWFPEGDPSRDMERVRDILGDKKYGVYSLDSDNLGKASIITFLPVVGHGWKILLMQRQQEVYSLVLSFRENLNLILILTIVSAIMISLLFSRGIAVPIVRVSDAANQFAAGKLDARIDTHGRDEVGQLARNFNFMAESLRAKISELNEAYSELQERAATIEETNRRLDRRVFEVGTLYDVSQRMGQVGIDTDRLLDIILEKAMTAAGATRGSLMLLNDDDSLELNRVMKWDDPSGSPRAVESFECNIQIKPGEGLAGRVIRTGEAVVLDDPSSDPDFKPYENQSIDPPRQLVCLPLSLKKNTFGVINLVNKADGTAFTDEDISLLKTLAGQAAMALENAKLFKLAITDGLTGLFMVRHFNVRMEEELKRSRRYDSQFSLLFMDIDHFKNFNDTYGHQRGDVILVHVAELIRQTIRQDLDIPGRYGGEEFIVLLPETDSQGALVVAERLRQTVEKFEFPGEDEVLHVTISIGISMYPTDAADRMELVRMADTALYFSKENGRNKATIYSDNMGVVSEK
ncbi:MAG: hypothetical protein CVV64_14530 [Candidatus Wallbacteria bacterium HGW-Wallbacteria-1]|jgi:diguanylate cyclase (GGDEF)-like protein|uniref:Diguanylate cyclase n=1 Tax=Candidatus Wallbacteria bacterium HGW-Wallbacteria-1 TaxID=2013854 RepID=A0A2N1PM49_9BACT|nr:MAG: hypothetical protein CVV64_14530 [Candidatus Wallbacteria bacterium HGW-Wallbacteria-1]